MPALLERPRPAFKAQRVMARKRFLKMLRLMRYATEAHLRAVFCCRRCGEPTKVVRGEGLVETAGVGGAVNPNSDPFSLVCACTVWRINP